MNMIKFIKKVIKRQVVIDKTNVFVSALTDEVENLSDTERVAIINETKTRLKSYLKVKNEELTKELKDNNNALYLLSNPNNIEDENTNDK